MTVKSHSGCWIELGFKSSVEPAENIGDYRITKTVLPMHDPRNPNPAAGSFKRPQGQVPRQTRG
jgi:hypothetical protein